MQNIQDLRIRLQSLRRLFSHTKTIAPLPPMTTHSLHLSTLAHSAKDIPDMPVLKAVAKAGRSLINFEDTAFFSVQHILRTNTPLFKYLIEDFKVKPHNIYLSGKGYSDAKEVENFLKQGLGIQYFKLGKTYAASGQYQQHLRSHLQQGWGRFVDNLEKSDVKRIIVIDEGGHSLETMPSFLCFKYSMAGIEQTRGGLYSPAIHSLPFPLIEVASSAIKRHLESPLIVEAIVKKLHNALGTLQDSHLKTVFGVIGNGAIGSSVTRYLLQQGYTVIAYDENKDAFNGILHKNLYRAQSVEAVIARADTVLGCTGKDTLEGLERGLLEKMIGNKKLISCTSEDKEFYSLRKALDTERAIELDSRNDIVYHTKTGAKLRLVNGGFPVNFDQSGESVAAQDIQLTRALMLGACIQAGLQASKPEGGQAMALNQGIQLDSTLQHFVAQKFRQCQPANKYSVAQWQLSQDLNWIQNNSGGKVQPNALLAHSFLPAAFQDPKADNTEAVNYRDFKA